MKHMLHSTVFGLLPLLGLAGCGLFSGDRIPEVTNAARLNVAMAAEASGDNQMALQIYAAALAREPANIAAAVRYARALVNNRQIGLARELLSRQLLARPGHPELSREFGTIEVMQGQAASAIPRFDVALQDDPNDVRALVNKGIALDMLGQHADAQLLYRRADILSPDDPAVRNNLAMSLMLHGRTQEASDVMQGVASGANSTPRMRNNMAVVAAANGDIARARQLTAGDISEIELQSLASQLRGVSPTDAPPVAETPVSETPVSARPLAAVPVSIAPRPAARPADTGVAGALPLAVPGQQGTAPAAPAAVRAVPVRAQDKRGVGRLNMTEATPAVIARVLERAIEKEAAFIGQGPSIMPADARNLEVRPAIAAVSARVQPVVAAGPRRAEAARFGYSVQLAAVGSEEGARAEWNRINRRQPFMMMGREATVERGTRGDGGFFWRLRTPGFTEYGAARQFCQELLQGGQDCFVTGGRGTLVSSAPAAQLLAPVHIVPAASANPAAQSPEG